MFIDALSVDRLCRILIEGGNACTDRRAARALGHDVLGPSGEPRAPSG
jgi:hypothetical protein